MIEIDKKVVERAILVAIRTPQVSRDRIDEYLEELEMLAHTAGAETLFKVVQDRQKIDTAFYIGKGKVEEIAELVEINDVNLIIFDDDLSPNQVRNLENIIGKKIVDRSGLILDIFAAHARTKEAKTQVELAQLQYMLPRLTRMWTHLSKQYGGIGTKGPGETQIETDRRLIRTRISRLKEKLGKIESRQEIKSSKREIFLTTSLVGYTNAGKSTLLNLLTDAEVLVENKLFATLDSTTRSFEVAKKKKIIISDTVGFIRKLPHNLIASFKSTLNVVNDADVVLHVIDVTNPFFEDHMKVVDDTLKDLGCSKKLQVKVFNKVDALENKNRIDYIKAKYNDCILISAERGINISAFKERLLEIYEENYGEHHLKLNITDSKTIAQIHSLADVTSVNYEDEFVEISYRVNQVNSSKIKKLIKNIGL